MLGTMVIRKREEDMTDLQRRLNIFLKEQNVRLDREYEEAREAKDWDKVSAILMSMAEINSIERRLGITKKARYYEWLQEVVRNATAMNARNQTKENGQGQISTE